jgi:hypothetical protein
MRKLRAKKDAPLSAVIKGNQLVITIGISTLALCEENGPLANIWVNKDGDGYEPAPEVTNEKVFAQDVLNEIVREDSDSGESALTKMLDQAIIDAVDNGSMGVDGKELEI